MLVILAQGGLAPGGVNFDAKVRRESFEPVDLFHAHIGGMDAFAWGLKIAAKIRARRRACADFREVALRVVGHGGSERRSRAGRRGSRSWRSTCLERGRRHAERLRAGRRWLEKHHQPLHPVIGRFFGEPRMRQRRE